MGRSRRLKFGVSMLAMLFANTCCRRSPKMATFSKSGIVVPSKMEFSSEILLPRPLTPRSGRWRQHPVRSRPAARRISVFAKLSGERPDADLQQPGGLFAVSSAAIERCFDQLAFHFTQREPRRFRVRG